MDNCEIIEINGNVIKCRCFISGNYFEVKLNG